MYFRFFTFDASFEAFTAVKIQVENFRVVTPCCVVLSYRQHYMALIWILSFEYVLIRFMCNKSRYVTVVSDNVINTSLSDYLLVCVEATALDSLHNQNDIQKIGQLFLNLKHRYTLLFCY
jgi:hypothetical protein